MGLGNRNFVVEIGQEFPDRVPFEFQFPFLDAIRQFLELRVSGYLRVGGPDKTDDSFETKGEKANDEPEEFIK